MSRQAVHLRNVRHSGMEHVDIQLFHDLDNDIQRFKEAVHGDSQHAICRGLVLRPQHSLVLNVPSILTSRVDKRE
jgi:hypothetical protein